MKSLDESFGIATRTIKLSLSPDFCLNDAFAVMDFLQVIIENLEDEIDETSNYSGYTSQTKLTH
jgi:hypothetical protein